MIQELSADWPADPRERGQRQGHLHRRNSSVILRLLLSHGPVARTDIAEASGLSLGAVGRLTAQLIGAEVLTEVDGKSSTTQIGRPRVSINFHPRAPLAVAAHIGVKSTMLALLDLRGGVLATEELKHPNGRPDSVLDQLMSVEHFVARHDAAGRAIGLGVVVGGWIDPERGVVRENLALKWRDVDVRGKLASELPYPIRVDSVVRGTAQAELWFGNARHISGFVHIFIGKTIDAAIVVGRSIHLGPQAAAGAIGHIQVDEADRPCACGRAACLEAQASDLAIVARARDRGLRRVREVGDILRLARAGDITADELLRTRARQIGEVVATLADLINPELVIVSGSGVLEAAEYLPHLRGEVARRSHGDVDADELVLPTSFGNQAPVVGAGTLVLSRFYDDPWAFLSAPVGASASRS